MKFIEMTDEMKFQEEILNILEKNGVVEVVYQKSGEVCLRLHRRTQEMVNKIALNKEEKSKELKEKLETVIEDEMPWVDGNPDEKWVKAGLLLSHAIKITELFEKNTFYVGFDYIF